LTFQQQTIPGGPARFDGDQGIGEFAGLMQLKCGLRWPRQAECRTADVGQADFQLLIDVRRFRVATDAGAAAEIGLSARIVDKDGKVVASRLFDESEKFDKVEPAAAVAAFDAGFGRLAKSMISWTVQALQ
jgi:uncharacterized lipoprotein YmbA